MKKELVIGKKISNKGLSNKANLNYIVDYISNILQKGESFPQGVEAVGFKEHLNAVQLSIPQWKGEGMYEVTAQTKEGVMNPAFRVYHWHSNSAPTIIYNHGAFQYPFDKTFTTIFKKEDIKDLNINLIIIRTPFHTTQGELKIGTTTLSKFLSVMAVSTKLTEEILQYVKNKGVKKVEVAGFSLGGMISNRHKIIYNTADFYIPIIAGTAHEKLFLKRNPTTLNDLERNKKITQSLNFTSEWNQQNLHNIFPVLAKYDDFCKLYEQGPSYGDCEIEIWNTGHLTTIIKYKALRDVLLKHFFCKNNTRSAFRK